MALKDKMKSTKPEVVEKLPDCFELSEDIRKWAAEQSHPVTANEVQRKFRIAFSKAKLIVEALAKQPNFTKLTTTIKMDGEVQSATVSAIKFMPIVKTEVTTIEGTDPFLATLIVDPEIVPATLALATVKKPLKAVHKENEEAEKTEAKVALEAAEKMVRELSQVESGLNTSYAMLAATFAQISNKGYFRFLEFPSMSKYIESLVTKYGKKRAQLLGYTSTAIALLPHVSVEDLSAIGISKAKELTKAIKATQKPPTPDVLKAAIDPAVTVADLLKILGDTVRIPSIEKGTWYDKLAQGFYASKEETDLFDQAWERVMRQLNLGEDTPDHIKRKMFLYTLAQEFLNVPEASQA